MIKNKYLNRLSLPLKGQIVFFISIIFLVLQNTFFKYKDLYVDGGIRYISIAFLYTYVLTIAIHLLRMKILKLLIYLLFVFLFGVNLFLYLNFKSLISPNTLLLFAETNKSETLEFLNVYLFTKATLLTFASLLVIAFIIWYAEKRVFQINNSILASFFVLISFLGAFEFCGFASMFKCNSTVEVDNWIRETHSKPMDHVSNLIFCSYDLFLASKEQEKALNSTIKSLTNNEVIYRDSLNVVLVIGESYSKWHSSLYGYINNTTPKMLNEKRKGSLVVFNDVISPYNLTSRVLRSVFSTNSIGKNENWFDYPFFPAVFKQAGYDVLFWDNQFDPKSKESFDFSLNSYLHNPSVSKLAYTETNTHKYEFDAELIPSYIDAYNRCQSSQVLSIIHLMGQHVAYYSRFPHTGDYDHFTYDSIPQKAEWLTKYKRQIIADYDNATYYNDYVMNQLFDFYKNKNTVLVYFSDHGEEIYDYQDHAGRIHNGYLSRSLVKYQYEVPFVVWFSPFYINTKKDVVDRVKAISDKPLSLDNVCHFLFYLGGVDNGSYVRKRNIADKSYQCPKRIINDSIDYDLTFCHY